ncbi:hypothetical protein RLIN73S_04886 [Rhodanobacter lindaniclasticus]
MPSRMVKKPCAAEGEIQAVVGGLHAAGSELLGHVGQPHAAADLAGAQVGAGRAEQFGELRARTLETGGAGVGDVVGRDLKIFRGGVQTAQCNVECHRSISSFGCDPAGAVRIDLCDLTQQDPAKTVHVQVGAIGAGHAHAGDLAADISGHGGVAGLRGQAVGARRQRLAAVADAVPVEAHQPGRGLAQVDRAQHGAAGVGDLDEHLATAVGHVDRAVHAAVGQRAGCRRHHHVAADHAAGLQDLVALQRLAQAVERGLQRLRGGDLADLRQLAEHLRGIHRFGRVLVAHLLRQQAQEVGLAQGLVLAQAGRLGGVGGVAADGHVAHA